jgi:4-hydroxy-2-oxoheptanedioate aldolase
VELKTNAFKAAIARGEKQIGLWSSLCSPLVAEIIGGAGFDWILIDTEHSPNELPDVMAQLQALATSHATPIVRPAWNDPVLIKRFLDAGAQTLLLPFVQNVAEAKAAVAATRYPPHGIRGVTTSGRGGGFGRIRDYLKKAPEQICVLVQIETQEALDDLEGIAGVEGVDGVFIGPADLSASMGHLGDQSHDEVQDAIRDAALRLRKIGKPAGILTGNEGQAHRYIGWGYTFVAVGADLGLLARNAEALATRFKC